MKKVLKMAVAIMIILIIPVLMDYLILGNNVPSNIGNDVWAGFLGSYIGGIATLLAVFITINDNNRGIISLCERVAASGNTSILLSA